MTKQPKNWAVSLVFLASLYFILFTFISYKKGTGIDFAEYYAAGRILLLNKIDKLYDFDPSLTREEITEIALSRDERRYYDLSLRMVGKTYEEILRNAGYKFYWITYYTYPPIFAFPFQGFSVFSFQKAWNIWTVINVFIILTTIIILAYSIDCLDKDMRGWSIFLLLCFFFSPLFFDLSVGNINLLMVLFFSLIYLLVKERKDSIAGIVLGLQIIMKIFPLFLLIYFLYRKRFKLCVTCILTVILLSGLSLALYGIEIHKKFIQMVKLNAIIHEIYFLINYNLYKIALAVKFIKYTAVLLIIGVAFLKIKPLKMEKSFPCEYSLMLLIMALSSVILFHQYYSFVLIPIIILSPIIFSLGKTNKKFFYFFIISYILMFLSYYHPLIFTHVIRVPYHKHLVLPAFFSTVILYLLNTYLLHRIKIEKELPYGF